MEETQKTSDEHQPGFSDVHHGQNIEQEVDTSMADASEADARKVGETEVDVSELPCINWGALLMPAVWGPAHGQWITVFFYPIWLLADTCFTNAVIYGGVAIVLAVIVFSGTAAATIFYACTAGRKAFLRVADTMTMQEYNASERKWVAISAVIALIFIGVATWYNLAVRLPAGPVDF